MFSMAMGWLIGSCAVVAGYPFSLFFLLLFLLALACLLGWRGGLCLLLGALWMGVHLQWVQTGRLSVDHEGKKMWVTGTITSLPRQYQHHQRFHFRIETPPLGTIDLRAYGSPLPLAIGQRWRFRVRLKRVHGLMNPGTVNEVRLALTQDLVAKGYLLPDPHNVLISSNNPRYWIGRLRQRVRDRLHQILQNHPSYSLLLALTLGDRSRMRGSQWRVLTRTGTSHLLAISGLHVGFVAGFCFWLFNGMWRRSARLVGFYPAPLAASVAACLGAFLYSALAGFSLSTQRALIMILLFMGGQILKRPVNVWRSLWLALLLILLWEPFSILSPGFWLSFGAVAILLYGLANRLGQDDSFWRWGRTQWVVTVGLLPVVLLFFHQASLVGLLANTVAIPWVGVVVVPLCLAGCLLLGVNTSLASFVLHLGAYSLHLLWSWLSVLSHLPFATWEQAITSPWIMITACIGLLWLLAPRGFPGRWLGGLWLLPLCFSPIPKPPYGSVWFHVLDAGQGLATVVQTQHHTLVYDTGGGRNLIVPFLTTRGIDQINTLVVSHGDRDHSGGAKGILSQRRVRLIYSSEPGLFPVKISQPCRAGQRWQWDGVQFVMLYPPAGSRFKRNNRSCVLKITVGEHEILLPGDIEAPAEAELVKRYGKGLNAELVIAPHHGSRTSSTAAFLNTVHPQIVVFAVGYKNRYHFPRDVIINRYRQLGAKTYNTDETGLLTFQLNPGGPLQPPIAYRQTQNPLWR